MTGIIVPSRAKPIGELQRFIMDWELRGTEQEARHNEYVQDSVEVAALKGEMTAGWQNSTSKATTRTEESHRCTCR